MTSDRLPGGAGSNPSCLWGRGKDGIHSKQVRHKKLTANKSGPLARLAEKTPLKMSHTKVCVTVCDCEEPNLVLAVEADLSDVVLEAFFHPTQLIR